MPTAGPRPTGRLRPRDRTAAVVAGLQAYAEGDFFEAHELMEPAWMGTDDPAERELIQGLIKLAAADVHGVRGNPRGVARNLEGARDRLRRVPDGDAIAGVRVDLPRLLDAIDRPPGRARCRPIHRAHPRQLEPPMNPAPAIPTIDVAEAERRLREDPDARSCSTSARSTSSRRSARRGPCSCRCRPSRHGPGSCRRTGR